MRLIDADALKKKKVRSTERCEWVVPVAEIDWMPTIKSEQKEGKWITKKRHERYPSGREYEILVCPFCGRTDHNGDGNYCGYCGAKMDGEEDE